MAQESRSGLGKFVVVAVLGMGLVIGSLVALESGRGGHGQREVPTVTPVSAVLPSQYGQVESDRVMTQQMGTYVGPGMQAGMGANGMLQRTSDQAYVRELEKSAHEVDRMLARHP